MFSGFAAAPAPSSGPDANAGFAVVDVLFTGHAEKMRRDFEGVEAACKRMEAGFDSLNKTVIDRMKATETRLARLIDDKTNNMLETLAGVEIPKKSSTPASPRGGGGGGGISEQELEKLLSKMESKLERMIEAKNSELKSSLKKRLDRAGGGGMDSSAHTKSTLGMVDSVSALVDDAETKLSKLLEKRTSEILSQNKKYHQEYKSPSIEQMEKMVKSVIRRSNDDQNSKSSLNLSSGAPSLKDIDAMVQGHLEKRDQKESERIKTLDKRIAKYMEKAREDTTSMSNTLEKSIQEKISSLEVQEKDWIKMLETKLSERIDRISKKEAERRQSKENNQDASATVTSALSEISNLIKDRIDRLESQEQERFTSIASKQDHLMDFVQESYHQDEKKEADVDKENNIISRLDVMKGMIDSRHGELLENRKSLESLLDDRFNGVEELVETKQQELLEEIASAAKHVKKQDDGHDGGGSSSSNNIPDNVSDRLDKIEEVVEKNHELLQGQERTSRSKENKVSSDGADLEKVLGERFDNVEDLVESKHEALETLIAERLDAVEDMIETNHKKSGSNSGDDESRVEEANQGIIDRLDDIADMVETKFEDVLERIPDSGGAEGSSHKDKEALVIDRLDKIEELAEANQECLVRLEDNRSEGKKARNNDGDADDLEQLITDRFDSIEEVADSNYQSLLKQLERGGSSENDDSNDNKGGTSSGDTEEILDRLDEMMKLVEDQHQEVINEIQSKQSSSSSRQESGDSGSPRIDEQVLERLEGMEELVEGQHEEILTFLQDNLPGGNGESGGKSGGGQGDELVRVIRSRLDNMEDMVESRQAELYSFIEDHLPGGGSGGGEKGDNIGRSKEEIDSILHEVTESIEQVIDRRLLDLQKKISEISLGGKINGSTVVVPSNPLLLSPVVMEKIVTDHLKRMKNLINANVLSKLSQRNGGKSSEDINMELDTIYDQEHKKIKDDMRTILGTKVNGINGKHDDKRKAKLIFDPALHGDDETSMEELRAKLGRYHGKSNGRRGLWR